MSDFDHDDSFDSKPVYNNSDKIICILCKKSIIDNDIAFMRGHFVHGVCSKESRVYQN